MMRRILSALPPAAGPHLVACFLLAGWLAGLLAFWLVGLVPCGVVGLLACRFVGLRARWLAGMLACRFVEQGLLSYVAT